MGILQLPTILPSQVGILPQNKRMVTTDNLATITTAGYLNSVDLQSNPVSASDFLDVLYSFDPVTQSGTYGVFLVSISNGVITLSTWANPGDVLLPVVSGDFAIFNGTLGQIKDGGFSPSDSAKTKVVMAGSAVAVNAIAKFVDTAGTVDDTAGTATNAGSIQAGASGTAGTFISFPSTAANGSLILAAANAGGAFNTTISNATMGQSTVYSIPDAGAATANFVVSSLAGAGVQHITTGSLQVDAGGLLSGLAAGGTAGSLTLYPTTTANGSLIVAPVDAGGAFNTTISNGTMGQSSVLTIPDPANALGRFLVGATATPFVSGNFPVASGTGGLMVDSGLAAANIQNKTNIIAATTADIGGGGAGPISVVVAGLTAASVVVASVEASSNPVSVIACTATATGFDITFSADPGAACTVNYIAFIAAQ